MPRSRSKPLVEMSPAELERTFDDLDLDVNASILEAARMGKDQEIIFAAALLTTPDKPPAITLRVDEYGDGEGIRNVDQFIAEVERQDLLRPHEHLTRVVFIARQLEPISPERRQ